MVQRQHQRQHQLQRVAQVRRQGSVRMVLSQKSVGDRERKRGLILGKFTV